jgi:hypothetical protein
MTFSVYGSSAKLTQTSERVQGLKSANCEKREIQAFKADGTLKVPLVPSGFRQRSVSPLVYDY